uniref:Transforming acidic coiled-coil-containing protein C-terminal domain-containing protein n=1 Tax=Glossina brevipalpis TaxID=37001 RepID=A0A1A9W4W4_9MUSC
MNDTIEAYKMIIAELRAEKQQLLQNYEKELVEVKADRDSNSHHLTSLEMSFSNLLMKFEKSKEKVCQLKAREEALLAENRNDLERLRLEEQRYNELKNTVMKQLEKANKDLECLIKDHAIEMSKLKASVQKEQIACLSLNEQLNQTNQENAKLIERCDDLILNLNCGRRRRHRLQSHSHTHDVNYKEEKN